MRARRDLARFHGALENYVRQASNITTTPDNKSSTHTLLSGFTSMPGFSKYNIS